MKLNWITRLLLFFTLIFSIHFSTNAQELYSARGFWEELNKKSYQDILTKKLNGSTLSSDEEAYLQDYEAYLDNYYDRMSEEAREEFQRMKPQWDGEIILSEESSQEPLPIQDFNLRARDRVVNGIYGLYYGASIVGILEVESGAAAGIPLIMGGLWQLGPVINPKKYDDITLATVRAGNSGKLLGLGYGASMGLMIGGESDNNYKWVLGLSSIGSIALGEIGFQTQKKKGLSVGYVEMVRHYGFLVPSVASLTYLSFDQNLHVLGGTLLAGGVAGLLLGNNVAKKYDYTSGDVDVVSSLTLISAGLGATIPIQMLEENESSTGFLLIPVATAVAGSLIGQKSVKGVKFTQRQGSTVSLASGGAALIGFGAVLLTESESPALYFGIPSVSALIMHQVLASSYRKKNLERNLNIGLNEEGKRLKFSMKVTPENYFAHKQMTENRFMANPDLTYPIVNFKLTF